jgi:hypothetical protein
MQEKMDTSHRFQNQGNQGYTTDPPQQLNTRTQIITNSGNPLPCQTYPLPPHHIHIIFHEFEASLLSPMSRVFAVLTEVGALELRSNHGSGGISSVPGVVEVVDFLSAVAFSMRSSRRVIALERTST